MTHRKRIALELLGPPLLGAVLFCALPWAQRAWISVRQGRPPGYDPHFFQNVGFVLLLAYVLAGIPSIVYTLVMEWRFARGLDPKNWWTVALSALLGTIAGGTIGISWDAGRWNLGAWILLGVTGLGVGFLLGSLIKMLSKPKEENREACGPAAGG